MSRTPKTEQAVGVFESRRYLDLEATHIDQNAARYTTATKELLQRSCDELLGNCRAVIDAMHSWLGQLRTGRFQFWVRREETESLLKEKMKGLQKLKDELQLAVDKFRNKKRSVAIVIPAGALTRSFQT
jgi:hypothetical protein